ncbi:hypothetical protein AB3N59_08810 [Leptospira sp. WS92.C1]
MRILYLSLLYCLVNCTPAWIRELPPPGLSKESDSDKIPKGVYVRNRPERSHGNTLYYKNTIQERILLNGEDHTFEKFTRREIKDESTYTTQIVNGKGKFSIRGNWLLLETLEKGEVLFQGNAEVFQIEYKPFRHKLLYHYDSSSKTLVPLLYESGYLEKTFGLLDGVNQPYVEDKYFQIARKNFLRKEFQFHAYFYKP